MPHASCLMPNAPDFAARAQAAQASSGKAMPNDLFNDITHLTIFAVHQLHTEVLKIVSDLV